MKKALQPCGTNAAYFRHRSNGEEPCGPCQQAHNDQCRDYNVRYRAELASRGMQKCTRHQCGRIIPLGESHYTWCDPPAEPLVHQVPVAGVFPCCGVLVEDADDDDRVSGKEREVTCRDRDAA